MSRLKSCALTMIAAVILTAGAVQAGDVYLGISMSPISASMARALQLDEDEGVLIDEVVADSPAHEAGLEAGDVIVAIGNRAITGSKSLSKTIHRYDPGDEVTITVVRSGSKRDLDVVLGEKKKKGLSAWTSDDGETSITWTTDDGEGTAIIHDGKIIHVPGHVGDADFVFKNFPMSNRGYLGIIPGGTDEMDGVLIDELVEDGPAAESGLRQGDLIVGLDDVAIANGKDLHVFLTDTEPGHEVSVRVMRDGDERKYDVELAAAPSQLQMADVYVPGQNSQPWIYLDTTTPEDLLEMEQERQEVAEMREELEELKTELQALREELERKK